MTRKCILTVFSIMLLVLFSGICLNNSAVAETDATLYVYLTNYPDQVARGEMFICDVEIHNPGC